MLRIPLEDDTLAALAARRRSFVDWLATLPQPNADAFVVAMLADHLMLRVEHQPDPELTGAFQYIRERLDVPIN
jgi:hypothetical protein